MQEVKLQTAAKKGRYSFPKGKDWNGNRKGRPRKPEIAALREAIAEVEKEKKMSLYKNIVLRAYKSDPMMIALMKKLLPDKIAGEGFGDTNIYNIIREIQQDFHKYREASLELDSADGVHSR